VSDTEDWKHRYLSEAREWEVADKRLRRALGRLAIAAEGQSTGLDAALARVQDAARRGDDQDLEGAIDEVSRIVRRLEPAASAPAQSVGKPGQEGASPSEFCLELIDALELSPERRATLRDFRESLPSLPPEQCLTRLALELSSTIAETESADGDVQAVLLALVDEVAVVQPGLGSLQTLRDALQRQAGSDWHAVLSRIIAEIRAVIDRISADKHELEALVREVSVELGDITGVLQSDQAGLAGGRKDAERLHELMREGVSRIQKHIETESDIERLKKGVGSSLEGIRRAISDFAESDAQRLAEATRRNEELQQRVQRMEAEAAQLQERLQRKREQLMEDTLTGARSRLAYDESLAQELSRFRRYQEPFCLAVLDIDYFKKINDSYGHSAGDKALRLVAQKISERLRETDLLFRVGGEEFVLLLPRTMVDDARPLVEEVRSAVAGSGFHFEGSPVPITLSAGLAEVREEDTAATIFARADDAMYRAKKGGRDRLVVLA
jgi:diguanylate cyclase